MCRRLPDIESFYMLINQAFEWDDSHIDQNTPKFNFRLYYSKINKRLYKLYEKEIAAVESENDKNDHSDTRTYEQPMNINNHIQDITYLAKRGKTRQQISRCPHTDRQHFAKGMCRSCYKKKGR